MPTLERILDPLCVVTRRPPVPASEKSNFMIRGADQLSFAADSNVPLCRALHKGTYAEDPVMQSGSCDHAFGSHMHLNRMVASST